MLTGVVCDDRPQVRRTVTSLLNRCGFEVSGETDAFSPLRKLVRSAQPTVVVLTLPVVGMSSLAVVSILRDEAPACEVIVLSAFQELNLAALEAGARALVPEEDPQALKTVLLALAAASQRADQVVVLPSTRTQPDVVPSPRAGSDTTTISS